MRQSDKVGSEIPPLLCLLLVVTGKQSGWNECTIYSCGKKLRSVKHFPIYSHHIGFLFTSLHKTEQCYDNFCDTYEEVGNEKLST